MKLFRELPHVQATCRDQSMWRLPVTEWTSLRDAWMSGVAFWSGHGYSGNTIIIKLADVTGLIYKDEGSLAYDEQEEQEERLRKTLQGDDL